MAEDLSTYTEVDPNSHISATSSRMTGTGINRNETAYAYYDKGADYFDALDIDFDICATNLDSNDILGVFGISNTLNHIGAFGTSDIKVLFYYPVGGSRGLYLGTGGALDYMAISVDTTYYCILERAAGNATVSLKVYSDSGRTTLLDTLTGTMAAASTKHRYIFGISSQYTNNNYAASGYVENVVINAVGGQSVIPIMMAHRRRRIL